MPGKPDPILEEALEPGERPGEALPLPAQVVSGGSVRPQDSPAPVTFPLRASWVPGQSRP